MGSWLAAWPSDFCADMYASHLSNDRIFTSGLTPHALTQEILPGNPAVSSSVPWRCFVLVSVLVKTNFTSSSARHYSIDKYSMSWPETAVPSPVLCPTSRHVPNPHCFHPPDPWQHFVLQLPLPDGHEVWLPIFYRPSMPAPHFTPRGPPTWTV
jgi:hypothetical protein